ncbi:MAG: hypothetical protein EXS08_10335 [Planctomycetes bacterium]|nr:hypothetical protein [Planctomycetota bacterium]
MTIAAWILGAATLIGAIYMTQVGRPTDPSRAFSQVTTRESLEITAPQVGIPGRVELQSSTTNEADTPPAVKGAGSDGTATLSTRESLENLRLRLEKPLSGVDLEAELQEKYRGFEPQDLLLVYPFIADAQNREMRRTLHEAIQSGDYVSELVSAGERLELDKYREPGAMSLAVAHRSEPVGNGLVEHKIVPIDRAHFPDMYARNYEEFWLHERIDSAGICTVCPPSVPVSVTVTERK